MTQVVIYLFIDIKYYRRSGRLNLQKVSLKYKIVDSCCWCGDSFLGYVNNKNLYCSKSCGVSAKQTGKPGSCLGKKYTKEHREKISKANTGKVRTVEMRKRYSESKKGSKGPWFGIKGPLHPRFGKVNKSSIESMQEGLRKSLKAKGLPYNKEGHPLKGVKRPDKSGSNSHFWKGGIATVNDSIRKSFTYINWRKLIFERDNYTCNDCTIVGSKLVAHHIVPLNYILDKGLYILLYNTDNGITLCETCHKDLHKLIGYKVK